MKSNDDDRASALEAHGPPQSSHRLLEIELGVADIAKTVVDILLQTASHHTNDRGRCSFGKRTPIRFPFDDACKRFRDVFAGKRARADQHLVQQTPKRPHIRPPIDCFAARLFRAHVGGSAQNHSHLRHRGCGDGRRLRQPRRHRGRWLHRLRQPEIQHFDRAVLADLHVKRFEVAMDDALFVCSF